MDIHGPLQTRCETRCPGGVSVKKQQTKVERQQTRTNWDIKPRSPKAERNTQPTFFGDDGWTNFYIFRGWTFCITCGAREHRVRGSMKKEETWRNPMTKAPTPTEKSKEERDNTKTPPKTSISQRLRTDLGRSVGETIATKLVWLNRFLTLCTKRHILCKGVYRVSIVKRPLLSTLPYLVAFYDFIK